MTIVIGSNVPTENIVRVFRRCKLELMAPKIESYFVEGLLI